MLINRRTYMPKSGRTADVIARFKTGANHLDWIPPFRVLTSRLGPLGLVVLEVDFESLADYERFWASFASAAESRAVDENFSEMVEPGGTNEIWEVV